MKKEISIRLQTLRDADFFEDLYIDFEEGTNGKVVLDGRATIKQLRIIIEIMESLNMRKE